MTTITSDERVYFADNKPYEAPERLEELAGPTSGVLELPITVMWAPDRTVDFGSRAGIFDAYQALLNEGTVEHQRTYVDAETLVAVWPELSLPTRVRALWESRFPELAARSLSKP